MCLSIKNIGYHKFPIEEKQIFYLGSRLTEEVGSIRRIGNLIKQVYLLIAIFRQV